MLRIGLTGGIGSGKSTVADLFAARGVTVIDADRIVHELSAPGGAGHAAIVSGFGPAFLDPQGAIDRIKLRQYVFDHPAERRRLESLLHPLVRTEMRAQSERARGPYVLLVIPLLFESGQQDLVDRVLVVDVDEAIQVERVQARSGLHIDEIRKILAAQIAPGTRRAQAHEIIENNRDMDHLKREVARLHEHYLSLAARPDTG